MELLQDRTYCVLCTFKYCSVANNNWLYFLYIINATPHYTTLVQKNPHIWFKLHGSLYNMAGKVEVMSNCTLGLLWVKISQQQVMLVSFVLQSHSFSINLFLNFWKEIFFGYVWTWQHSVEQKLARHRFWNWFVFGRLLYLSTILVIQKFASSAISSYQEFFLLHIHRLNGDKLDFLREHCFNCIVSLAYWVKTSLLCR